MTLQISAKDLGYLALDNACSRCFWVKTHAKLPYQIFPGIFSSIDSFSKKVTNVHYEAKKTVPSWFLTQWDFVQPVPTPSRATFFVDDPSARVKLTGVPDEVFQKKDKSYFIADYKTARFTENSDQLMPMYVVQLNAYAYIGDRTTLKPVTGLGLVYYEPPSDLELKQLNNVLLDDGFYMSFRAKLHPVALKPDEVIPPLMIKARDIFESTSPPKARDGCEDCKKIDALIELLK